MIINIQSWTDRHKLIGARIPAMARWLAPWVPEVSANGEPEATGIGEDVQVVVAGAAERIDMRVAARLFTFAR